MAKQPAPGGVGPRIATRRKVPIVGAAGAGAPAGGAGAPPAAPTGGGGTIPPKGKKMAKAKTKPAVGGAGKKPPKTPANAAPVFTTHPDQVVQVVEGSNTIFKVVVTGTPAPALQWEVFADVGTAWNRATGRCFVGETTNSLVVVGSPMSRNRDRYRCVATNVAGTATSNEGLLQVTARPPASPGGTGRTGSSGTRRRSRAWIPWAIIAFLAIVLYSFTNLRNVGPDGTRITTGTGGTTTSGTRTGPSGPVRVPPPVTPTSAPPTVYVEPPLQREDPPEVISRYGENACLAYAERIRIDNAYVWREGHCIPQ